VLPADAAKDDVGRSGGGGDGRARGCDTREAVTREDECGDECGKEATVAAFRRATSSAPPRASPDGSPATM
jgi:hypothetical protein